MSRCFLLPSIITHFLLSICQILVGQTLLHPRLSLVPSGHVAEDCRRTENQRVGRGVVAGRGSSLVQHGRQWRRQQCIIQLPPIGPTSSLHRHGQPTPQSGHARLLLVDQQTETWPTSHRRLRASIYHTQNHERHGQRRRNVFQ